MPTVVPRMAAEPSRPLPVPPLIEARALVERFTGPRGRARIGADVVFGYPGGVLLPLYDVLGDYPELRHVLVRHEQGAAHAADGYARATGRVGVCLATSGPGATNLVTGIATAMLDSSSIVAITGNVASSLLGKDAFRERALRRAGRCSRHLL